MSTLNVKVPDGMEEEIDAFLEAHPQYLNRSELVRDALRHMLAASDTPPSSTPSGDDPLFSAPTVTVDEPVDEDDIDDVVYGDVDR